MEKAAPGKKKKKKAEKPSTEEQKKNVTRARASVTERSLSPPSHRG